MRTQALLFLFVLLLIGVPFHLHAQDAQPDYRLDKWRVTVRKVTPELIDKIDNLETKPALVILEKGCDQAAFEAVCKWQWIEKLNLDLSPLSDISSLAVLQNLKVVFLSKSGSADNQVPADLGVFGKIAGLESLRCQAVKVTNVQGLAGLNKLTEVSFSISPIDSLDFVKGTPALENLNLYGFQHSFPDYTPLLHLKNLKHLDIYMNKQATDKNLQPLNGLTTLESISMSNSRAVTTLDFLQNCHGMKSIDANWAVKVTDFSALESMQDLMRLQLKDVPLDDISFLKGKSNLTNLDLSNTKTSSLVALSDAANLRTLALSGSVVSDLAALRGKDQLEFLHLSGTNVTDISPLAGLKKLSGISLTNTGVTDFTALLECPKITRISLPHSATATQVEALEARFPRAHIQVARKPE